MSFSTLNRRNTYTGDGTTTVFPYSFKIFNTSYLRVVRRTLVLGVPTEVTAALGTDYTVSGVGISSGGNVTFNVAPLNGDTVVILGAQPLSQDMSIRNQDAYYPATIEDGADQSRMIDQQLQEVLLRAVKLPVSTPSTFNPHLPILQAADNLKLLRVNQALTGFEVVSAGQALIDGGSTATGKLKAPTDGAYGGTSGNPANVAVGDLYEDAFDKVATLLGKMVPPPPNNLSALTLVLISPYTAKGAADGMTHTSVTDSTSPTLTPGLAATFANSFGDPDNGTLSATLDAAPAGSVTLTTGDDSGLTNGSVTVISEFDPYAGQSGKAGLYKAITAKVTPTGLAVGQHIVALVHSLTGSTAITFYIDDPGTPVISTSSMTPSGTVSYKSGVPAYATGATLTVGFSITGAIRTHYNATQVASVTAPQTNTVAKSPASAPGVNATYSDSAALTVNANQYTENATATITGYNSKGATGTGTVSAAVRIDTIGAENRVTSSTGQYPTSGYGSAYDSTLSLANNKALQYIAGAYRYPPAVSYAASQPAGPDYSGLTPDAYANMRWVTFNFGSVNAVTSVSFTLQSASGFTSTLQSGVAIYVRVDGGTPTAGWVDANAAYSGTGSPTNNGDGALDVSQSTATFKRVTFGSTVRTGTVFVRIGIPQGSTKFFGGIA